MTNDKRGRKQRWRDDVAQQDSQHYSLKQHKEKVEFTRRSARLVVFWSFISLCYTLGDLKISTSENSFAPWGIKLEGITSDKINVLLLILTTYFFANFLFVMTKVHLMANSILAIKDMVSVGDSEEEFQRGLPPSRVNMDDMAKDRRREEVEKWRDTWLMMLRYPIFGFLEYFFASAIFPFLLYVGSTVMLLREIVC